MKIMVIDDVFMNILRLKEAVRAFGEVEGYQNAREGLEALQFAYLTNAPYDLLFLDILMPELSGFEVLDALVKMGADRPPKERTKVVMVTSRNQEESVRQSIRSGASGYVIKPFQNERIHAEILRLTGMSPGAAGAPERGPEGNEAGDSEGGGQAAA